MVIDDSWWFMMIHLSLLPSPFLLHVQMHDYASVSRGCESIKLECMWCQFCGPIIFPKPIASKNNFEWTHCIPYQWHLVICSYENVISCLDRSKEWWPDLTRRTEKLANKKTVMMHHRHRIRESTVFFLVLVIISTCSFICIWIMFVDL
jgi:hypothetical protein